MTRTKSKVYSNFALAAGLALGVAVGAGAGAANAAVVAAPTTAAPPVWYATNVPLPAAAGTAPIWYATSVATMAAGATATPVLPRAGWPFLTPQHRSRDGHVGHRR